MSTNEPMTQERLNEIQKRLDAATKGRWYFEPEYGEDSPYALESAVEKNGLLRSIPVAGDIDRKQDATLFANAPQDLTDLLAEVERLRALTTVNEDMVERAARSMSAHWYDWHTNEALGRQRALAIAALDAALGTEEEA